MMLSRSIQSIAVRPLMAVALAMGTLAIPATALADNATFTWLRTVSVPELNTILDQEREEFLKVDEVPLVNASGQLVMPPGYTLPTPAYRPVRKHDLDPLRDGA